MVLMLHDLHALNESVCCAGLGLGQATTQLAAGRGTDIEVEALSRFSKIAKLCDVVVVDGSDLRGRDAASEFSLKVHLANTLGLPVVAVVGAVGLGSAETVDAVDGSRKQLASFHCSLLAVMVYRANARVSAESRRTMRSGVSGRPAYLIPETEEIARPTVGDVSWALGLRQLGGNTELDRDVRAVKVAP